MAPARQTHGHCCNVSFVLVEIGSGLDVRCTDILLCD